MGKIYFLLFLQVSLQAIAQDCGIVTQIQNDYLDDAKILALREIYSDSTSLYADSIEISTSLTKKYLGALSVIHSMENDVVDTIFNEYSIHTFPDIPYMEMGMIADTSYDWVQNYIVDSVISGNAQFDSLMVKYDFKLQSYIQLSVGARITIITSQYLNLEPLVDSLSIIQGLDDVDARESWKGDGNNIDLSSRNDTTYIEFSLGWGDCPSGCSNRKYWNFSICDCNATYMGTSGDNYTSIHELYKTNYNLYPNPVNDFLVIEKSDEIERIDIYNLDGKLIVSYDKIANQIDLSELETGQYLLRIQNNNNENEVVKIIKR